MRSSQLALLVALLFVGAAVAQTPVPPLPPPRPLLTVDATQGSPGRISVDDIVERLLSFDKNMDGKLHKDEMIERMQDLIAKGDVNKDGALDKEEINRLAATSPGAGRRGSAILLLPGGRGIAAGIRPPPRPGIEGVLDDLKLPSKQKEQATAAIEAQQEKVRQLTDLAATQLLHEMKTILTAEELTEFKEALDRQPRFDFRFGAPGGRGFLVSTRGVPAGPANLDRQIDQLELSGEKKDQARAVVKAHNERVGKLMDAAGPELMLKMQDVLTDEEFGNFKAALDRQPGFRVIGGVVSGVVGAPSPPPPANRGGR